MKVTVFQTEAGRNSKNSVPVRMADLVVAQQVAVRCLRNGQNVQSGGVLIFRNRLADAAQVNNDCQSKQKGSPADGLFR